jgi:hypothetical protein
VDEDGPLEVPQIQEGPHEIVQVVARYGPDIGKSEFLEEQSRDDKPLGELLGPFSEPGKELPVGHRLEQRFDALPEGRIELSRHHPVQVSRESADVLGDGPLVVVQNDDEVPFLVSRLVHALEGEAGRQGPVADHRDDLVVLLLQVPCHRQTQRGGDGGAGVPRTENVA